MNGGFSMDDFAFIRSLEIARDDRLQQFRPVDRLGLDEVRRGTTGEGALGRAPYSW
jgi:hypothetical protein